MFVIHACWLPGWMNGGTAEPGQLGIWGEDSSAPAVLPRKPGRKPRVQAHPFAAAHEDLFAVLASPALKATASTVTVTLPTRALGRSPRQSWCGINSTLPPEQCRPASGRCPC